MVASFFVLVAGRADWRRDRHCRSENFFILGNKIFNPNYIYLSRKNIMDLGNVRTP